jgi:hypothetical protein
MFLSRLLGGRRPMRETPPGKVVEEVCAAEITHLLPTRQRPIGPVNGGPADLPSRRPCRIFGTRRKAVLDDTMRARVNELNRVATYES